MVLTTGILLIGKFQYGIKQSAELETAMTSVERILEYGNMKGEEEEDILKCSPPSDWPKSGKIQFHRVTLTYGKEGETNKALKNVTFDVKNGEKVSNTEQPERSALKIQRQRTPQRVLCQTV